MNTGFLGPAVATVLTACGIETKHYLLSPFKILITVATVLTACGIETYNQHPKSAITGWLQQYLPLAVLKRRHSL